MTTPTRHDPYGAVHKGIRAAHMRCLVAIGAADPASDAGIDRLAREIADHLAMCHTHLQDEDSFLHTALERRRPGASAHAAEDHDDHQRSFVELDALLSQVVSALPSARPDALAQLYRRFARFVADDLLHMDHEEHVLLPDLQAAFTDLELQAIEGQIIAAIPADRMAMFLDAMMDGLPQPEVSALLGAMQAAMPPEAHAALMQTVHARRMRRNPLARVA